MHEPTRVASHNKLGPSIAIIWFKIQKVCTVVIYIYSTVMLVFRLVFRCLPLLLYYYCSLLLPRLCTATSVLLIAVSATSPTRPQDP